MSHELQRIANPSIQKDAARTTRMNSKAYEAILLLALTTCGFHIRAEPTVEGIDLVSSTRVDRTRFDYTYAIRFRADSNSYTNSAFNVQSSSSATVVTKKAVSLGSIDAGTFGRSSDTFTIRHDRVALFDAKSLTFTFSGTPAGVASDGSALQIGSVVFAEKAGRPGHEGTFPIQADSPPSGGNSILKVNVGGKPKIVTYAFVDTSGQQLSQGVLTGTTETHPDSTAYLAPVTIPTIPFRVQITATPTTGSPVNWQSAKVFSPPKFAVQIAPTKALVKKSEAIPTRILLKSGSASGIYIVAVQAPSGFSGNFGPWTVQLTPGRTTELTTTIFAPSSGDSFELHTITAIAYPQGLIAQKTSSNLRFTVQ